MKALLITLLITSAAADELKFRFKSPTFNGAGYSAHLINLENMRYSRKKSMRNELKALELQAQILEDRKPINAFLSNLIFVLANGDHDFGSPTQDEATPHKVTRKK